MDYVDQILAQLAELITKGKFVDLETDGLEIKPVPPNGGDWKERYKSVNAFLNTRGGILLLGVKEELVAGVKRYVFTGWKEHAESQIANLQNAFRDIDGNPLQLTDCFRKIQLKEFQDGRVAIIYVDELVADRKYAFFDGVAYKRVLTGDHKITQTEIESQEELKREAINNRELHEIHGLSESSLDLTKINHYIYQLNQPVLVETMKSDIAQARPFLERKCFLRRGSVTILGALVCAQHPGDHLGFRAHVHGYVDLPDGHEAIESSALLQDKQDFVDNILQLMEQGIAYLLRNIQVGVSAREGGISQPQYPSALLRETVNNALAHRDYKIDRQVILAISPGRHISICNPGTFRKTLLVDDSSGSLPIRRIIPEAKPRNPKLADVLRVYRKWEGRGIGMATLVNMCLQNQIDLPYYKLKMEEVCLFICTGRLVDERMGRLFDAYDGYLGRKMKGRKLNEEQRLVLAYFIKSEWANRRLEYTILLTPDNNHYGAIHDLEQAGLLVKHSASLPNYPIYVADRVLMDTDYIDALRELFGYWFDSLDELPKRVLGIIYRYHNYNKLHMASAKQASYSLWYEKRTDENIEQFDSFYRKIRRVFNKLSKLEFIVKKPGTNGYRLNDQYRKNRIDEPS